MRRIVLGVLVASLLGPVGTSVADEAPTYEHDVRPLLAKRCTVCHNAGKVDDADVSGGLALDTFGAVGGSEGQKVAVPGKPDTSPLYLRLVTADEDERMPYLEDPLPEVERETVRRWIEAGMPRGEPLNPATASTAPAPPPRRISRNLDVLLPTEAKVPGGLTGVEGGGGPLGLVAKIGPLPAVTALAFHPEGRLLAVGTAGTVVVWDLVEARPAVVLAEIPGSVHALAFRADGQQIAIGAGLPSRSGVVRVYSFPEGQLVYDLAGHTDVVYGLAFRPDGQQLATGSFDHTVRLWDLASGQPAGVAKGHSDFVQEVAYAPDGKTLLSASKDRSIKQVETASLASVRTFSGHDEDVLALAARPDGEGFVTAGLEPQLRWWSYTKDDPVKRVGGHGGPVHQLAFSADGRRLISASGDRTVRLWDGKTGNAIKTLPGPTEWQYAVALSADAKLAAGGGWDGIVRVWDTDAAKLHATLLLPPGESPTSPDWLVVAPSGYWDASPPLAERVRFRVGDREPGVSALAERTRQTDPLRKAIAGEAVQGPFEKR